MNKQLLVYITDKDHHSVLRFTRSFIRGDSIISTNDIRSGFSKSLFITYLEEYE